jgi:ATPase subunit of ABC transporter with duplicated ATPase domains
MIFVSHDRHFLNKFAERIFELRDGVFNIYEGNYDYYLKKKELEQQQEKNNKVKEAEVKNSDRGKVRRRTDAGIRSCEQRISRLEADIEQLNSEILKHSTDYAVLMDLLDQKKQLQEQLDNEYDIWMENQD